MQDTVIYAKAKFKARSDTLANWQRINPVLLSGETAVVTDGSETEKIKLGDGVTPFNQLGWFKGPKGDNGENYVLTESDKQEIAQLISQPIEALLGGI